MGYTISMQAPTYPIVQIRTQDGFTNHGLYLPAKGSEKICIHIHGTAGNFYDDVAEPLAKKLISEGLSFLSTNNRGSGTYDMYTKMGAGTEIF